MTQQRENRIWEWLLKKYGAYELERRIQRRELTRLYNRKWPYDQTTSKVSEEVLAWQADDGPSPEEQLIMTQERDSFLSKLTPAQQDIAVLLEQGYKPRDIAKKRGDENSGAVRWQKHNMKDRLTDVTN